MSTYRKLELLSVGSAVVCASLLVASKLCSWTYNGSRFGLVGVDYALEIHEYPPRPHKTPHVGSGWTLKEANNPLLRRSLKLPRTFRYAADATGDITLVRVIIPFWIPLIISLFGLITFRQLNPARRIHFFAGARAVWEAAQAEFRHGAKASYGQLIRKLPLAACSLAAMTFAALMLPFADHPVFFQASTSRNTIMYFVAYKSVIRLGTFSMPKPAMLQFEADSPRGLLTIQRSDSDEMLRLHLPGAVDFMRIGPSLHELVLSKPHPCPDGPLFQSQLRSWTGTPMILFAIWPVAAFVRGPVRRFRRRSRGLCTMCGYDLAGNTSGVCPECGTARGN